MIHSFKVENFYSISEEQTLNFVSQKKYSGSYGEFDNCYINLVNCFVGANASGKTNLFKALSFLIWFAENSFYQINDNNTKLFATHKLSENKPTKFEIIFNINSKLYRYSLIINSTKVLFEKLEIKSKKGFSYIYILENVNNKITIKYNRNKQILSKINPKEESRFKSKSMATFFSFLSGIGYFDDVKLTGITNMRYSNVYRGGALSLDSKTESLVLSQEFEKSELKTEILSYLKSFDFGIENYVHKKFKARINDETFDLIGFKHSNQNDSFNLPIFEESAGTIKGMYLLLNLLEIIECGGIAIIDEFDTGLHYDVARKLIGIFADKNLNTNNAQLIFSTHQPLFLNDRDKSQIFLCYKEDYINTEVYRLDDVEGVRNTENFFEKYLSGEYGATPRIGVC